MGLFFNLKKEFFILYAQKGNIWWTGVALIMFSTPLFSQGNKDLNKISIIEKRIEMIAEDSEDEEIDFTTLFDDLLLYYENPLDLNIAEKEQLQSLALLSEVQISNLLKHIKKNGKLIAIYELQSIDGFDLETIQLILPFIKVSGDMNAPKASLREMLKYSNNEIVFRNKRTLESMKGYQPISDSLLSLKPNSRYLGTPDEFYTKIRIRYKNNISIGFVGEKDAGEEFFRGTQKQGYDFNSAHFYLKGWGNLKHLAIGDYVLQFGQGLTLWNSRASKKSAEVLSVKRNPNTIRPFASVGIYSTQDVFCRGAAATYSIKKIDISGFYSKNYIDGAIFLDTTSDILSFSAGSGSFHRTPDEVSKKKNIDLLLMGGHAAYKGKQFEVGLTAAQQNFGATYFTDRLDNQFNFIGNNFSLGLDYNYVVRNLNFFGEVSKTMIEGGGKAQIHGVMMAIDPRLSLVVAYRNYERNFWHLTNNPFRESYTSNETGTYFGLVGNLTGTLTLSGYIDKYKFPWLTYNTTSPSNGVDYLTQLTFKPSKTLEFYIRYKNETKEKSYLANNIYKTLFSDNKQNLRLNSSFKISHSIKLRNRVELVQVNYGDNQKENGYVVYQDIIYDPMNSKLSVTFRYGMFDTDSYLSGIYVFENEVLGGFAIPAYYYRGTRTYIILQYKLLRNLDLWLRWGQTYYSNRDVISSGLNEIEGNTRTEVKAQIRYKF